MGHRVSTQQHWVERFFLQKQGVSTGAISRLIKQAIFVEDKKPPKTTNVDLVSQPVKDASDVLLQIETLWQKKICCSGHRKNNC